MVRIVSHGRCCYCNKAFEDVYQHQVEDCSQRPRPKKLWHRFLYRILKHNIYRVEDIMRINGLRSKPMIQKNKDVKTQLQDTINNDGSELVDENEVRELLRRSYRTIVDLEEDIQTMQEDNDDLLSRFTQLAVKIDEVMKTLRSIRRDAAKETG